MKRIACSGIGLSLLLTVGALQAGAQNQAPANPPASSDGGSLGAYARNVRKDTTGTAKPKVFDNDNLPREDKLSVVGKAPDASDAPTEAKAEEPSTTAPTGEAKPATADKTAGTAPGTAAEDQAAKEQAWKQWAEKLSAQKDQIDLLQRELDVLQREYQVRAAAMYADVGNRLRNSADWDQKDAQYKQQIADKQKALDDAKQKLDDMNEEARKAGVPSSVREP
jgi:hypothetical protein